MLYTNSLNKLLEAVLTRISNVLIGVLGEKIQISEISVIRSEPGCPAQPWHSDNGIKETIKSATMFFALHDIVNKTSFT